MHTQRASELTLPGADAVHRGAATRRSLPLLFLALALGLLWFQLCRALSNEWSINEQYSYGWFVPFFAAYLFWLRWEDRPKAFRISDFGFRPLARRSLRLGEIAAIAIVCSAIILLPIRLFEVANPDWRPLGWLHAAAVVAITLTTIWAIGGAPWLRHFAFPVAFIFVAVPWVTPLEAPIVQGLMRIIAGIAAETISLFGVPAQVQGNIIRIPSGVIGVNEACSGVRSLQTSLMIGLLFGELKRLTISRRLALLGAAVAIALIANLLRALFLVAVAARQNLAAVGKWHDLAGYAIVALVFIGTMWMASKLGGRGQRSEVGDQRSATVHHAPITSHSFRFGLLLLFWLLAVEIGIEWWYRSHERNMSPVAGWTIRWPEGEPGFREIPIDQGVRATLRFDQGREVTWTSTESSASPPSRCFLFFFRWNPGGSSVLRARAHRPDICLPSAGWRQLNESRVLNVPLQRELILPFHEIDFRNGGSGAIAHTYFCLQEDRRTNETRADLTLPPGVQPDWSLPARWKAVRDGVRNMGQQVLEFAIVSTQPISQEAAETQFEQMLPKLIELKN